MGMPMRWLPIIDRRMQPNYGLMTDPVEQALAHLGQLCTGETDGVSFPITLNFHPDIAADGENVIELLARHGTYRSQFETGTSSGGLTAIVVGIAGAGKAGFSGVPMTTEPPRSDRNMVQ